jgi:hypothetical protein
MTAPIALVNDLLEWVAARPRTYRETMDAWRTSCPKLPVWEDAVDSGFLRITRSDVENELVVVLSAKGRTFLTLASHVRREELLDDCRLGARSIEHEHPLPRRRPEPK